MRSSAYWPDNLVSFRAFVLALNALVLCVAAFPQSDPGSYDEGTHLYRNRTYAFAFKVPAGWVLRTEQIATEGSPADQVFLAAFERPPEATGPAPASTILIAAESQSAYPGLKTAEDYFAPLTEVVAAKGFKPVNDPYPFKVGPQQLVRADFVREAQAAGESAQDNKPEGKTRRAMYQSTLVMLSHGTIVSFTFLAASEDEVDNLIENLSFTPSSTTKSVSKSPSKSTPKTASPRKLP